ncbi:DUF7507 domain-containing protein [Citricoccus alkalitolerans]|uniref:VWA domain-containing protein n=1 Tax=Citricoccus alkalitolerans TaxID=246603 RepID=A0ABV8XX00_9MICC
MQTLPVPSQQPPTGAVEKQDRILFRRALAFSVSLAVLAASFVAGIAPASAVESSTPPDPNPAGIQQCEDINLAISMDLSNSVTDSQLTQMKNQLESLVNDLQPYPINLSIHNFATNAPATTQTSNRALPLTSVGDNGQTVVNHIQGVQRPASSVGGTNWDAAFDAIRTSPEDYEALLFLTDGNPTQYTTSSGGIGGPGNSTDVATITAAVESANALKAEGTRIVTVGLTDNLSGPGLEQFHEHVRQVSGEVLDEDYYVADFAQIARQIANDLNTHCATVDFSKSGAFEPGSYGSVGEIVTFDFTAHNSGAVPMSDVRVSDAMEGLSDVVYGEWPTEENVLYGGETITATATYAITQEDIDRGYVRNVATFTGAPPAGDEVDTPDEVEVPVPAPSVTLTKSNALVEGSTGRAGDEVQYTFTVTNDGNTELTDLVIDDPLEGLSEISFGDWPSTEGTLLAGESVRATATYTLTQADVNLGAVDNTATVSANPPTGPPESVVTDEDSSSLPVDESAALTVEKNGSLAVGATGVAGDTVTYDFTLTNNGNVTLTEVGLDDPLDGLSEISFGAWPADTGVLQPGEFVTATATYGLTQEDVDAGGVDNTATAAGTTPSGNPATGEDTETVPVAAAPQVSLLKSGELPDGANAAGETIDYTFDVTNDGNVTLSGVTIADELEGLSDITYGAWPNAETPGVLAPGEIVTATATYTLTQSDVDAGGVDNTATVTGTPPAGDPVTDTASDTVEVFSNPLIDLIKTGGLDAAAEGRAGDTVTYGFTVTNNGNVTLGGVGITDELDGLSGISYGQWPDAEAPGVLAPGEQVTAQATYDLTQADVDAGSVENTATVTGSTPGGDPVEDDDGNTVSVEPGPVLELGKTGALADGSTGSAGDTVEYTFQVTNSGNVTLSTIDITDEMDGVSGITFGAWPGAEGTLAPGQQVTATATYVLTQDDVDAGAVENTATVTGTPPNSDDPIAPGDGVSTVPIPATPGVEITKTSDLEGNAGDGYRINYTFDVVNTGNVTLTAVAVTDGLLDERGIALEYGSWPDADGVLAPGERVTATATYPLTQTQVDSGSVENTASVTGTPPNEQTEPPTDESTVLTRVPAEPSLELTKSNALAEGAAGIPGDEVTYTFEVENTGNVTIAGVEVTDEMEGLSEISFGEWPDPEAAGSLAPGQTVTATATYALTQADLDAGVIDNTASVTGTPPNSDTPVEDEDGSTQPLPQAPTIDVAKSGAIDEADEHVAGTTVGYDFTVTNTGNVTLTGVSLSDELAGISEITFGAWPTDGAAGTLAPGESVTATATYTLTQADVDAGQVDNLVTAAGTPPSGDPVGDEDTATVPVNANPALALAKTGLQDPDAEGRAGDVVTFTFSATNTGNVTLSGVAITDELDGLSGITYGAWPAQAGVLAPGERVEATATYELTQADVDAGSVVNTATVTGTPPNSDEPIDPAEADSTVPVEPGPGMELDKIGMLSPGASGTAGDTVEYTFTATNTGNVTLSGVAITDELDGLSGITYGAWPAQAGVLAPGERVEATATYVLTQADVDAGGVVNTATVTGTPPNSDEPIDPAEDGTTVLVPQDPLISVDKDSVLPEGATPHAGDRVDYTFTVTNEGNVTLDGVTLSDELAGLSALEWGEWPGVEGVLTPGQTVTAIATLTLTQEHIDAGGVENTVDVRGTPPTTDPGTPADPVTGEDTRVQPLAQNPGIAVEKSSETAAGAGSVAGDTVTYTFEVENTGNVTLEDVALADELEGLSGITVENWPNAEGVLAPGETAAGTATYTLTQTDVDAGGVDNRVSATGTPPNDLPAPVASDEDHLPLQGTPRLSLEKSASLDDAANTAAGDTVTFTFEVENTGTVTLSDVGISDGLEGLSEISFGDWPAGVGTLAPGETVSATATYQLTQADVDAHGVDNSATVTGTPPNSGTPVRGTDDVRIAVSPEPAISLEKTADLAEGSTVATGETVDYTFRVVNDGNVTLTDVAVADEMPGLSEISYGDWPGAAGTLAPGEEVVGSATYVLTQADVDSGTVENTATVSGTPPTGGPENPEPAAPIEAEDSNTYPLPQLPELDLTKTGSLAEGATGAAGDTVHFSFEVENTGNVTITDVTLTDRMDGLSEISYGDWPSEAGTLAPGETVTASATYQLTQADADAGGVDNTASVIGTSPTVDPGAPGQPGQPEGPVDEDSVTVPVGGAAGIELEKSATLDNGAASVAGDTVRYTFEVTNAGAQTLSGIVLTDEMDGLSEMAWGEWPGEAGTLAPGESVTAAADYRLTQADLDAGAVVNTADVTATTSGGDPVSSTSTSNQDLPRATALGLVKLGALTDGAIGAVGDEVVYTFEAANTGNVTITDVVVHDEKDGVSEISYGEWPAEVGVLAPGESITATALYRLTEADVAAGTVDNQATVTGTDALPGEDSHQLDLPPLAPADQQDDQPADQQAGHQDGTSTDLATTGTVLGGLLGVAFLLLLMGLLAIRYAKHSTAGH